jgi:hypothetical protein
MMTTMTTMSQYQSDVLKTNAAAVAVGTGVDVGVDVGVDIDVGVGVGDDEVTVNVTMFETATNPFASKTITKYL